MARRLDGRAFDVQRAPQPLHEEGQGCRSETPDAYEDVWSRTRERESRPNSLHPSRRTIWERALVGSEGSWPTRRPSTPPKSTSQIYPGRAAHYPKRRAHERFRAYASASSSGLQTTTFCREASKRMRGIQIEEAV